MRVRDRYRYSQLSVVFVTAILVGGFFVFGFVNTTNAIILVPYLNITGRITNLVSGDAISGANVDIIHGTLESADMATDEDGVYRYSAGFCDRNGVTRFTITAPGYKTLEYSERFSCYRNVERDFKLVPDDGLSGNSNIMFLPGLQASRLYKGSNTLWEPNTNADVKKLYLDEFGQSVEENIHTSDIVDEIPVVGKNIYKTFIEFLDGLEQDGTINEWKAIPYDWRYDVMSIVNGDIRLANSTTNLVSEVEELADTSQNKNVTIIAHSNGGLLAKALMVKLEELGKDNLIDKLILVASPQIGTPQTLPGLLHGDDQSILLGIVLGKSTARKFGENMPGGYGLIPSDKYFSIIASPVIEFSPEVEKIYNFRGLYGDAIDNKIELNSFLLGDEGKRKRPKKRDTDSPNVLNGYLLDRANETQSIIDSWEPSIDELGNPKTKVIQIAGWGIDTVRGIYYDDCDIPFCPQKLSNLDREMLFTEDGDGTVLSPSATAMNHLGGDEYDRYYVDLKENNTVLRVNRKHADIMEVDSLKNLIKQIVEEGVDLPNLPKYIASEKPASYSGRLRLKVKSPISIDAYDSVNVHTGLLPNISDNEIMYAEENIPNSYYYEIGEKKYIGLDTEDEYKIKIQGLDFGSFTLILEEVEGDRVVNSKQYTNIPVTPNTTGSFTIRHVESASDLALDIDGDGKDDIAISSSDNPNPLDSLEVLQITVGKLDIHRGIKRAIIKQLQVSEYMIKMGFDKIARRILGRLVKQLKRYPEFLISSEDAGVIINVIERVRIMIK